jgi:CRISPR-associated protein Cas1
MTALYLVEQGATVRKDGETLVVVREGETLARVPLLRVEQVVVFGNVQLTTPVLVALLQRGIDTVLLSVEGRYRGRLVGPESRFGELRLRQLEAGRDAELRLALARRFLQGKLANQRTMVLRYARTLPALPLADVARGIADSLTRLERAHTLGGLLAAEGYAAAQYYRAIRSVLR